MNKKFFKSLLSSVLAVIMVVSLFAIPSSAAAALSKSTVTITKGYATTLTVKGTTSDIKWSTGNKAVATVSSAGKVAGKGVGSTYIYAQVDGTTLKCQVNVVAGKITPGMSSIKMTSGDTAKVNITAKGTHSIVVSSSDKSVVTATWNGASFNEDVIPLTLTAKSAGTSRITIYAKSYPDTVYAYIDVTVKADSSSNASSNATDLTIIPMTETISVAAGASTTFKVYTSEANAIALAMGNAGMASASLGTVSGKYTTISVAGLTAGNTTLRISSKTNSRVYVDVPIAVTSSLSKYYVVSTTIPTKSLATDLIIQFSANNATRYMLVPVEYDEAYANTLFAEATYSYSYYTVYSASPSNKTSSDTIYPFQSTTTTSVYGVSTKYILLPKNHDTVKLNTAIAKYKGVYDYYTVYNISPTKTTTWDEIETWTVTDSTGTKVTRYMLIPYPDYYTNPTKASDIIAADKEVNQTYAYYTVYNYSARPTTVASTDELFTWYDSQNVLKCMIVPKTSCDYLKRNDAILKDTGVYCYYNFYTTLPSNNLTYGTHYLLLPVGNTTTSAYMLINPIDSPSTQSGKISEAASGKYSFNAYVAP